MPSLASAGAFTATKRRFKNFTEKIFIKKKFRGGDEWLLKPIEGCGDKGQLAVYPWLSY